MAKIKTTTGGDVRGGGDGNGRRRFRLDILLLLSLPSSTPQPLPRPLPPLPPPDDGAFDQRLVTASVFCFEVVLRSGFSFRRLTEKTYLRISRILRKSRVRAFWLRVLGVGESFSASFSAPPISASLSQMSFVSRRFDDVRRCFVVAFTVSVSLMFLLFVVTVVVIVVLVCWSDHVLC